MSHQDDSLALRSKFEDGVLEEISSNMRIDRA